MNCCQKKISAGMTGFMKHKSGNVAVLAAILLPVVIGCFGLGSEVGYWYLSQRKLQQAVDASAYSAGVRKRSGDDEDAYTAIAQTIAFKSGLDADIGTVEVFSPPTTGVYTGDNDAVEVVLTETHEPLFAGLFREEPVVLSARSVVLLQDAATACIVALSTSASKAMKLGGTADVVFDGCNMASNSLASDSFSLSGSGSVTTGCAYTVGSANVTSNLNLTVCTEVSENAPYTADPYRDVTAPAVEGPCINSKNVGKPHGITKVKPTYAHSSGLPSRRYCAGLSLKGDVEFEPGLYIIDGGTFSANAGANVSGEGVIFYLTGGATMSLNGGATFDLSARTSDPFSGLLFFGDRTDGSISHTVNGGTSSVFQGAIYFPASNVTYNGGAGVADGCTQIVADTIELVGNSTIASNCDSAGTKAILVGQAVEHVE